MTHEFARLLLSNGLNQMNQPDAWANDDEVRQIRTDADLQTVLQTLQKCIATPATQVAFTLTTLKASENGPTFGYAIELAELYTYHRRENPMADFSEPWTRDRFEDVQLCLRRFGLCVDLLPLVTLADKVGMAEGHSCPRLSDPTVAAQPRLAFVMRYRGLQYRIVVLLMGNSEKHIGQVVEVDGQVAVGDAVLTRLMQARMNVMPVPAALADAPDDLGHTHEFPGNSWN